MSHDISGLLVIFDQQQDNQVHQDQQQDCQHPHNQHHCRTNSIKHNISSFKDKMFFFYTVR